MDFFGMEVFQNSFSINLLSNRLTFAGEYSAKMAPSGNKLA
jgi:hypothetical protein